MVVTLLLLVPPMMCSRWPARALNTHHACCALTHPIYMPPPLPPSSPHPPPPCHPPPPPQSALSEPEFRSQMSLFTTTGKVQQHDAHMQTYARSHTRAAKITLLHTPSPPPPRAKLLPACAQRRCSCAASQRNKVTRHLHRRLQPLLLVFSLVPPPSHRLQGSV